MGKAKRNLGAEEGERISKGDIIQFFRLNISCLHSSTHSSREVVFVTATGAGEAVEARAKAPAITKANNNNPLNNDTLQSPPPVNSGQLLSTHSGHRWETIYTNHKNSLPSTDPIYSRKYKRPPSGRQTKVVRKGMGKTRCSPFPLRPIAYPSENTRSCPGYHASSAVTAKSTKTMPYRLLFKTFSPKRYREGKQGRQPWILQPTFLSSQTRKSVETRDRPQFSKSVSHGLKIQNGNPRIHSRITEARGMGYLYRPFGCLPSSSHSPTIKEVSEVPPPRDFLPVHQHAVRASHSPTGFHIPSKGGQTVGTKTRHPVAPIPG